MTESLLFGELYIFYYLNSIPYVILPVVIQSVRGVVECLKVVTKDNAERLSRYAFEFARNNGRKKVTTIHKANIM